MKKKILADILVGLSRGPGLNAENVMVCFRDERKKCVSPTRKPNQLFGPFAWQHAFKDAPAAIKWSCQSFGFEKHLVVPGEGETIAHAELSSGNVTAVIPNATTAAKAVLERVAGRCICLTL